MSASQDKKKFHIIDGNSYIYRAFYAVKGLSTSTGLPTNAVFGFANMLLKIVKQQGAGPLVIAFDPKGPTRRHTEYREYKAHRPPMPKDLVPQIPYIHRLVKAFNIPVYIQEGQEADDVIASLALRARQDGHDVVIVTGDKDILQLVAPGISVYDPLKEKTYTPQEVEERFGVPPARVVEIMGLMGDAADNIPGVPGIGEKTSQVLIKQYGTIEEVLAHAHELTRPKLRQSLLENAGLARLSRDLALLRTDLDVEIDYRALEERAPDDHALRELFRELEFTSLLKMVSAAEQEQGVYRTVLNEDDLRDLAEVLAASPEMSIDTETTSLDAMQAKLVGISFSVRSGTGYYLPLAHTGEGSAQQLPFEKALAVVKPLLENDAIAKIGQNLKYDVLVLRHNGIELKGITFDTMIASYLLNPSKPSHGMDAIALEYLNYRTITYDEVTRSGRTQKRFDEVDVAAATRYSGEDADIALRLKLFLEPRLLEQDLDELFRSVEMKLMTVLADMEFIGVRIDASHLADMSLRLERETAAIRASVHELAGSEFNINSPKQLAEVLFVKLGLTPVKRTKSGFSTDVDVLEQLSPVHPLPAEVLRYRTLAKLKSTYVDALPAMINPSTGRLHTSLNQTVTATGRLSSSEPNLQNIPVRTDMGREIRRAFVAEPGRLLLSADYSQIELRILAHLSGDRSLIDTFIKDEDIHARTASEILGLPQEEITPEMRRRAKAVNFGIIYGMSAFGLAQDIGVSNAEAKRYIDGYFARYPGVRAFIDRTIATAKEKGFVTTLMGRRRFIPELSSANAAVRSFGERMAVNTPIQGTAADLIKMAMINIHGELSRRGLGARMILQVHDELIFEVPDRELDAVKELVRERMEGVVRMEVPIRIEMGAGRNWDEAH